MAQEIATKGEDSSVGKPARRIDAAGSTAGKLPPDRKNPPNRHELIFAEDEALFYGQPLAAVLAEDPHTAEEALELIEVDYEELPARPDPVAAMREDSPLSR